MQILQLSSFPIEQVANLEALEHDLAAWFGARDYGVRLLAYSQAFNMRPAIERVRRAQAGTERVSQAVAPLLRAIDAWRRWPWLSPACPNARCLSSKHCARCRI